MIELIGYVKADRPGKTGEHTNKKIQDRIQKLTRNFLNHTQEQDQQQKAKPSKLEKQQFSSRILLNFSTQHIEQYRNRKQDYHIESAQVSLAELEGRVGEDCFQGRPACAD